MLRVCMQDCLRLLNMVKRIDGMPNKDMGKFADQINSLCDKWQ